MILGSGDFKYELVEDWLKVPEYFDLEDPVDIAVNSKGRIYVTSRGNHPVLIFNSDGSFVSCWGEGYFVDPHGVWIGPDDSVYVTDRQMHVVEKFTPGGERLMTLGTRGRSTAIMLRKPFNEPTDAAIGPSGDLFVCDGYGNFLVHRFSADGKLLKTWGDCGNGPGQFSLPHRLAIDGKGIVYVCDRTAGRIQVFTPEGEFVDMWTGMNWPQDLAINQKNGIAYVIESQLWPPFHPKLTIRDLNGKIISSWGEEKHNGETVLDNSHSIALDSQGSIYVAEIVRRKRVLKFARVR